MGERAVRNEVVHGRGADDEAPDVDRPVLTSDVGDRDMQPAPVRQRRIDERLRQVQASARDAQHALDEVAHLIGFEHDGRQLAASTSRNEDPTGFVDPQFFHEWVVEVRLQRTEAGDVVMESVRQCVGVEVDVTSGAERIGHRRRNDLVDEPASRIRLAQWVEATITNRRTHITLDVLDAGVVDKTHADDGKKVSRVRASPNSQPVDNFRNWSPACG